MSWLNSDASTPEGVRAIMRRFNLVAIAALAIITSFCFLTVNIGWFQMPWVASRTDALIFVSQNLTFAGLVLWAHVFWVSTIRSTPNEERWHEGHRPSPGSKLDFAQRVTTNTLEQTAIFALSQLALASTLPLDFINVTRALLIVWIIGRFLFVIGYSRHPFLRTFGMSPTLLPPILAMGYAAWQILVG